ncbi:urease accessory protein UreF [Rhodovulum sp. DZ06]|uniref:urease accessory protein UreF n=1 Tax=Rhodovulum sp. DZ06 TaxID=3425126 RepID=UPI003D33F320
MTETQKSPAEAALILSQWLSSGYPTGAFAWSHGLENAVAEGAVTDAAAFRAFAADCLEHGAGRSDAILLAHAWRDPADDAPAELAEALAPSKERRAETLALGAAFAAATAASWGPRDLSPAPYPVAFGRAARAHGIPLELALPAYLQAFAATLASAAQRLVPLGHTEAQQALAALAPVALRVAAAAEGAPLDAVGGAAFAADIAAMRHEVQQPRLFRS